MLLHKAAKEFSSLSDPYLNVWCVKQYFSGYIVVKTDIGVSLLNDNSLSFGFIEKQRGGRRVFKTLDAAANAIMQIGQLKFDVEFNIKD